MPAKVDPQKATKQWAIVQAVIAAGPEATLLYADESLIKMLPLLRAMWHRRGQQVRIPTPGTNVSLCAVWCAQHPHRALGVPST